MDGLRLPDGLRQRMLAAYRTGLEHGYPELVDDGRFGLEITSACALKLLWHLSHLAEALERDRVVGHFLIRRRQRLLAVLDGFMAASNTFDQLPQIRKACQQLRSRLAATWRGSVEQLPLFPIFRGDEPAAAQLGPGQVGGEAAAAVPDDLAGGGVMAG